MPTDTFVFECIKTLGVAGGLLALLLTWRAHTERATFEMIDRLYTLCHTLEAHAMREWSVAHLYCIGASEYDNVKAQIVQQLTDRSKFPEYVVKEKLFAVHVFIIYEQVYYQWTHSSRFLHRRRRRFLADMLSYFTDRLLQNPRLLYFLQEDKEGASLHLEKCSKAYVDGAIAKASRGMPVIDREGPFGQRVSAHAMEPPASSSGWERSTA